MYRLRKTIEAATYLLARLDGEMPFAKLVKLLYLADREQMKRRGTTITHDAYWSVRSGPILEHTLDAIKRGNESWNCHMQTDLDAKVVSLIAEARPDQLSRGELQVLDAVLQTFGRMRWPDLVAYARRFPEWTEVAHDRRAISLASMAKGVGYSDEEAAHIVAANRELDEVATFMELVATPSFLC